MKTIRGVFMAALAVGRREIRAIDDDRAREAFSCYSFMGCVGRPDERYLLKNLRESYALARLFAGSPDFRRALARFVGTGLKWVPTQMPPDHNRLLVANCSLWTLSLIADAKTKGWHLVVEDVPFSRNFIAPVGTRGEHGVEFVPGRLLPARRRAIRRTGRKGPVLFVTFCDRPMSMACDGIETEVGGGRYHLSVIDALLMVAAFDEVFVLGKELRLVAVADGMNRTTGRISGEILFHCTSLCGNALSDMITFKPGQYLGMVQLVTRSAKYRVIAERNKKSLVKSLLHYCQINGMPIAEQSYRGLLRKLDVLVPASETNPLPT